MIGNLLGAVKCPRCGGLDTIAYRKLDWIECSAVQVMQERKTRVVGLDWSPHGGMYSFSDMEADPTVREEKFFCTASDGLEDEDMPDGWDDGCGWEGQKADVLIVTAQEVPHDG